MKVELCYSQVEDIEVAFLRGICDCPPPLNQKNETVVPNETTERRGGRRFLSKIFTCENTSLIVGVIDQGINTLRRNWIGSVFILPNTISPKSSLEIKMAGVALQSSYGRIGFSAEAVLVIIDTQGIDFMEELDILTDGEIENLCKFIRMPGGINPITNVAKLGLKVSLRADKNLTLASFFLKNKIRTGRVALATDITLDNVRLLHDLKESKKEHTDPLVSPVIYAKNWPKTMESLEEYLRGHNGFKGVPIFMWLDQKNWWHLAWMNLILASSQPNMRWLRAYRFLKVV